MQKIEKMLNFPHASTDLLPSREVLNPSVFVMPVNELLNEIKIIFESPYLQPNHEHFSISKLNKDDLIGSISNLFLVYPDFYFLDSETLLSSFWQLPNQEKIEVVSRLNHVIQILNNLNSYPNIHLICSCFWNERIANVLNGLLVPCYFGGVSF